LQTHAQSSDRVIADRVLASAVVLLSAKSANLRASAEQASASTSQGLAGQMPAGFDADVARVVAELDQIEADTLRLADKTTLDRQGQIHTLGELMLFDKHLSVKQTEAWSFCHTPETGFIGPIQSLNLVYCGCEIKRSRAP
jgi:cytochrome c peroxidase